VEAQVQVSPQEEVVAVEEGAVEAVGAALLVEA
jgi:hypothetical protein